MRIRIITCHDVYNAGASLQAYALMQYLKDCGHEVKIIDYKPDYLSRHYSLKAVNNPEYDRAGIREIYLLVKMPGRIKKLFSKRKDRFDAFRKNALELTDTTYRTCEELKNIEEADLYLAGSDQIWNPIFPNGKDPAFFLQFTEKGRRASYAASFAVDALKEEDRQRMKEWLKSFDAVSVREQTGAALVKQMGLQSQRNCDPVFLLKQCQWKKILPETETNKKYVLLYDFDKNCVAEEIAEKISKKTKTEIWSVFKTEICDKVCADIGPLEFVNLILNAEAVVSNSFHATAFAIIFHKEFFVIERKERINTRMNDLLKVFGVEDRKMDHVKKLQTAKKINWQRIESILQKERKEAEEYLAKITGEKKNE